MVDSAQTLIIVNEMTKQSALLDGLFKALGDPARRAMIERLSRGPASVSELSQPLRLSMPSVMQHLRLLEACGLVRTQKVGRVRRCSIVARRLSVAEQWIAKRRRLWERRLDLLDQYFATGADEEGKP